MNTFRTVADYRDQACMNYGRAEVARLVALNAMMDLSIESPEYAVYTIDYEVACETKDIAALVLQALNGR